MTNVATVTMNPSVDIFTATDRLVDDGKSRCQSPTGEPGGGGINVARNLHRFGVDVAAVFTVGGPHGQLLKRLMMRERFSVHAIDIEDETRQSLAFTEKSSGKHFHLVFPGPELKEPEWRQCLETLDSLQPRPDYLALTGSLPGGVPAGFYAMLARSAVADGVKVILDTSGRALLESMRSGVYLTKLKFSEFVELGYSGARDYSAILKRMGEMVNEGFTDNLIVTLDADGALLASSMGERLHARPPQTKVISHVGAGDSFVSLLICRLCSDNTVVDAFRYGVAAAAAKVNTPGNQLMDLEKVESIVGKLEIFDYG